MNTKMHLRQTVTLQTLQKNLFEQTHSFNFNHNTMQILQWQNKRLHLDTLEYFYIYTE